MDDDTDGEQLTSLADALRRLVLRNAAADADAIARAVAPIDAEELHALRFIGERGSTRMRDLRAALAMPPSSATGLVDKLVEKGLVERGTNEADRRIVLVSLTRRGKSVFTTASETQLALCREMLSSFAPAERDEIVALLGRLVDDRRNGTDLARPRPKRRAKGTSDDAAG
jgi:DNA-binding MarR family transcriptional regulator